MDFFLQKLQIEKVIEFKSGEYGSQSVGVQNSAKKGWVVLEVRGSIKSARRNIFCQDTPNGLSWTTCYLKSS